MARPVQWIRRRPAPLRPPAFPRMHPRIQHLARGRAPRTAIAAAALLAVGIFLSATRGADAATETRVLVLLPAVDAVPVQTDTLFLGGYARGSFADAVGAVASELSAGERTMIGRHLDRIFPDLLVADAMGRGGRLRLAYERVSRPDGSTRSIRVLAAEAAVGGALHTAFFFEEGEKPGYFDGTGRSLDPRAWAQPLRSLRVTSPFGMRRVHPILRRAVPHTGTDYAAAEGAPVFATGDGSVSFASRRGGYGNLVEIQHPNGYATRYAHLSRIAAGVRANAPVRQGEVIGYAGMTGLATAPHLHYEVRRRDRPVDPEAVSPLDGPAAEMGTDLAWREERRLLGRLLARAPRLVSRRGSLDGAAADG